MSDYTVLAGDTFELIARKIYGSESDASLISRSNPGVAEPLIPGVIIVLPLKPDAPQITAFKAAADNENEVALSIEGKRFRFWESIRINRELDTFDTIEFTAPFQVDNPGFKEAFQPLSYKGVSVTIGGVPFFTGTILPVSPELNADRRSISVSGYSLPGVLNDCSMPASAFPLEFNNQGLQEISKTVAGTFGLGVEFTEPQGAIFERVAADPTKKAFQFLVELAKQRNLIISNTAQGKLLFRRSSRISEPVARLAQGSAPVTAVTPQINPQNYYSHITGLQPAVTGSEGSQFTAENPRLKGVIRPLSFKADDTAAGGAKEAVDAKMARMFADTVKYSVDVSTWRDPQGALWEEGSTITLVAPGAMVYNEYKFLIRSISFLRNGDSEAAVLSLTLPGVFEGIVPETLPWDL